MTSVSLCMIVKDEESFLEGCLETAVGVVDEIIVVDTGSSDATSDIAHQYTGDVHRVRFDDDFGAARNEALALARSDWILTLDADERLAKASALPLKDILGAADDDIFAMRLWRYNVFSTGSFYTDRVARIFRNLRAIRYRGAVAETVVPSVLDAGGRIEPAELIIDHLGYTRPRAVRDRKALRYLCMLESRLKSEGGNAFVLMQTAVTLVRLGRYAEAQDLAEKAVTLLSAPQLDFLLGHVMRSCGDDVAALTAFERAAEADPSNGASWNMVGVMHLTLGRFKEAENAFARAAIVTPCLPHTALNLGILRQFQGRYSEAADLFRQVAAASPALMQDDWRGRVEMDPHRNVLSETIYWYAGLAYHLALCTQKASSSPQATVSSQNDEYGAGASAK